MKKMITISSNEVPAFSKKDVDKAIKSKIKIMIQVGPNNVHDILDSLDNH